MYGREVIKRPATLQKDIQKLPGPSPNRAQVSRPHSLPRVGEAVFTHALRVKAVSDRNILADTLVSTPAINHTTQEVDGGSMSSP